MNDFLTELKSRQTVANNIIAEFMPASNDFNKEIVEAMKYSLMAGGKRLRPVIMNSFYRLYGGEGKVIMPFMAAMEMLHTYSLVHDDLPAIDNDELRRGMPTTHAKFGEAIGVLAGDGLLHMAYETAIKAFEFGNGNDVIRALKIFGDKTGLNGMFGGQSADVINTGKIISEDLLYYVYENKTAALLEGSMMIGATLAGASDEDVNRINEVGSAIGLAFQIRDDILDEYGDEIELGKPINSDIRNDKTTYLSINGKDKSQEDIDKLSNNAISAVSSLGNNEYEREFLIDLFKSLCYRNK